MFFHFYGIQRIRLGKVAFSDRIEMRYGNLFKGYDFERH
jgi:hypothetical protein